MATPDGEGGGGEGGESSEESGTDSGVGQAVGSEASEEVTSKSDAQQPQYQDTRKREAVKGTGEKYLKVTPYTGPPSQPRLGQSFGAPPPLSSPKHIHLHAGPHMNVSQNQAFIRVYVNEFVVDQDFNTGAVVGNNAYDTVVALEDVTEPGLGAPYHTDPQGFTFTQQQYYNAPVGHIYDDGFQVKTLSLSWGQVNGISNNQFTNQFYIEYENNATALPEFAFTRKIRVTWASGDDKTFEVVLPGAAYLDMGYSNHQNYGSFTRADACEGDRVAVTSPPFTSESLNYVTYHGNSHNNYAYLGFFKEEIANGISGLPGHPGFQPNTPVGYVYNDIWDTSKYYDFSYDTNDGPFQLGTEGQPIENYAGEQYYKGIIGNFINSGQIQTWTPVDWLDTHIQGNAYDYVVNNVQIPPWQSPIQALNPYQGGGQMFRFSSVHIYAENLPDCATAPPAPVSFNACLDPTASDYYGYTYVDCASNDLTNQGGVNYISNPQLATWIAGACCTDCNNLNLSLDFVTDCSTQGGSDGAIQVTVVDSNGNLTGNTSYTYVMQALNGQNIGGLGTGSVSTPVTVGASGLPGGSNTGAQGGTFTYGFGIDLAQDNVLTPQNTAFAGSNALNVTVGGNTNILVPASTDNGTFSTGLIAGCYRIFVYDSSVNAAGATTPCFDSIDVCVADGVGVIGCTDNSAGTNFGVALNYNANAVVDDGSCQYCHATNGTLIDNAGNVIPTNGDIAVAGINSFAATPTQRTNSNDGSVIIQNVSSTLNFQNYINSVINSNGVVNADFTLRLWKANTMTDWDNAQSSTTPNDLTNFSAQAAAHNNGNMGWAYTYNTTTLGANINYGYYAVQVAISDPDAVVEIEECFQVFYFIIPIEVCVDPSNTFATAITDTNVPPGTTIINDPRLWHSNPSLCQVINNFCCDPVVLTNPNAGTCNVNQIVADFNCSPLPINMRWDLEFYDGTNWVIVNTNNLTPTTTTHQHTYTQASSASGNSFIYSGNYRVTLTSDYATAASCTVTSAIISITDPIYGCTDPTALNYYAGAQCDDGSCAFCIYGCMDSTALNYNANATCADTCVYPIYGCTDPTALNYDPTATVDDGSCLYGVLGCTDTAAYNFNQNCNNQIVVATVDDGCCFYPCDPGVQPPPSTFVTTDATGNCGAGNSDGSITVTTFFGSGVMSGQTKTIEYFTNAGVSIFADPTVHSNATSPNHFNTYTYSQFAAGVYYFVITDNFGCQETHNFSIGSTAVQCGCTDPNASNYDPTAVLDDGSCLYSGCTDSNALNYDPNASTDDGSCVYPALINPCIPTYTNDLIELLRACVAKNGFQYYNKLVTGQADDCSVLNAWKVLLIEYIVSKRGNSCIYNCADSSTSSLTRLTSCSSKWVTGGPATGLNDQAAPGSSITTGEGTTITDPSLFFVSTVQLFSGDVIKMPSGLIYEVTPGAVSCTNGCWNPETSQGAKSGHWQQCIPQAHVTSFNNNVNYLDRFNTFVTNFCVDCNIVDENVIQAPRSQNQKRAKRGGTPLDGISGLEI